MANELTNEMGNQVSNPELSAAAKKLAEAADAAIAVVTDPDLAPQTCALEIVSDPKLTPAGLARHVIERAYSRELKTAAAQRERDNRVLEFASNVTRLIQCHDIDGLQGAAGKLARELERIVDVEPSAPVGVAAIQAVKAELVARDYTGVELDGALAMIAPDARVTGLDFHGISTSAGRIHRTRIRERMRPATWIKTETWMEQFPKLPALADRLDGDGR